MSFGRNDFLVLYCFKCRCNYCINDHCAYFNGALPTETKRKISTSLFFSKQFLQHNVWLQVKDINARLERIQPQIRSSDGLTNTFAAVEIKTASFNPKKSSPKAKSSTRETSLFGG